MMCPLMTVPEKTTGIIESIIFISTIVIVLGLFSLPIILHYTVSDTQSLSSLPDNDNLSINSTVVNCSSTWGQMNDSMIDCIEYTGIVCKSFLTQWHYCAIKGDKDDIRVNVSVSLQNKHEGILNQLNIFLDNYKECQEIALPFLCQYYYPLSDCSTSTGYTASKEDCIDISTGICADLWQLAIKFGYGSLLPNCTNLPTASSLNIIDSLSRNNTLRNSTTNSTLIPCRNDFIRIDSICEPRCDKFEQGTHTDTLIMIYSEIIAAIGCLLISTILLILSIKERKTMFVYPSVLVLLQVLDTTILSLLFVITSFDRNGLYCSSVSLLKTLDNPTFYCTFSGVVYHFTIINLLYLWFFNVIIFFHRVMFPFQANQMENLKRNKFVFATIVALSTLLPLPAVIVCLSVKKYQYNMFRFPTTVCLSNGDMWFYSVIFPIDIILAIGLCLLIVAFWSIRKKSNLFVKKKRRDLSIAEKKIALSFFAFIIMGAYILGLDGYVSSKLNQFKLILSQYFTCEAFGHIPGKCDRSTFDNIFNPLLLSISYFLSGLIPLSVLNFVLKWNSVKKFGTSAKIFFNKHTSNTSSSY